MPWRMLLYIRFDSDRLVVRDVHTSAEYADTPDVAMVRGSTRIVEFGVAARNGKRADVEVRNPFGEADAPVHDYDLAVVVLRHAIIQLLAQPPRRLFVLRPDMVVHPLRAEGERPGGERETLERLGKEAGGRRVIVHYGPELSAGDVRELRERAR